jgi:hypothetical protein
MLDFLALLSIAYHYRYDSKASLGYDPAFNFCRSMLLTSQVLYAAN